MRVCVIFNPAARGDKARHFRAQLNQIALTAGVKPTRSPGDASALAAEAVREGYETIVAAGGDGTINEVLNGIGQVPDGFERSRLGVLPLGTVNVFARELLIPLKLDAAWKVVLGGRERRIDLPRVELEVDGRRQCRWFVQLAGAGLDARAIELVNWQLKKKVGPLAYVYAGLKALVERKPLVQVKCNGVSDAGELVLVGNGRLYGGNFRTFEQARLDDGQLDVCLFPRANFFTLLCCAGPLVFAGRLPERAVRRLQSQRITLTGPAAFELDGELCGRLPATILIERERLRVVAP